MSRPHKTGTLSNEARQRNTLKLGVVCFFIFPLFILLLYLASSLANENQFRIPLELLGGLGLTALAGIGNFWQKKYKISLQQMAGAIAIGTTLSLVSIIAIWTL